MNRHGLQEWVAKQGKTHQDLQRYVWWEAAQYLSDLSLYELFNELSEGGGSWRAQTLEEWYDYFEDLEDEHQRHVLDSILTFWKEMT